MTCNICGVETSPETSMKKVLKKVGEVQLPAVKKFVAADKFKVGLVDGVEIFELGSNFKENFLDKIEKNVKPATLNIWKLYEASLDDRIRLELGWGKEEISLAHFWAMLKKCSKAKNTIVFFGYIHGTNGKLWAVYAYRSRDGWHLSAYSVTCPLRWYAGSRVFSR